jgi:hypothetical protein
LEQQRIIDEKYVNMAKSKIIFDRVFLRRVVGNAPINKKSVKSA